MKISISSAAALLLSLSRHVQAKAVFAHFMVDNTENYSTSWWKSDMVEAATAGIDAFALNIAAGSNITDAQLPNAFDAAASAGFKLFFSFDYAGNGAWDKADVVALLTKYAHHSAYFQHSDSTPLVSTFEGPENAADWVEIKTSVGCFLIPDWSSLGAKPAVALENGVADGLFNWSPWSWGGESMDTYTDASYIQYLDGKPYMMGASPWFYTNLPGYSKNWMWPDHTMKLWGDRWTQIMFLQPEYVEIISWNDFGESHYIGDIIDTPPYLSNGYAAFDYITGMKHYPLRWPLQVWTEQYKTGKATVKEESLVLEYLLHSTDGCSDGGTPVNTATQLQYEYSAGDVLGGGKYIGYYAVLASPGNISISVGGKNMAGSWASEPAGGVGVYYGSVFVEDGASGTVAASIIRNDQTVFAITSDKDIGGCDADGNANFNPYVYGDFSTKAVSATETAHDVSDLVCTAGTGAEGFAGICAIVCKYGYCPSSSCTCTNMGLQNEEPKITGDEGHALSDPNYEGLCSWVYNHGYTTEFTKYCTTEKKDLSAAAVSPFLHKACTSGQAGSDDSTQDLCAWACAYGYCPNAVCRCTGTGTLLSLDDASVPSEGDVDSTVTLADDSSMFLEAICSFACDYGLCICYSGSDDGDGDGAAEPPCDYSLTFDSLEALAAAADSYEPYCAGMYALGVLSNNHTATLSEFNDANNNYDSLFGYYVKYVKGLVAPSIWSFMKSDGYTYFTCNFKGGTSTFDCPNPSTLTGDSYTTNVEIEWTLTNETGFHAVLGTTYGVEPGWVKFAEQDITPYCAPQTVQGQPIDTCHAKLVKMDNFPQQADDITVSNPKDLFTEAGANLTALPTSIDATLTDLMLGQWGGSIEDIVDVYTMPVALAFQAVKAMEQVKSIGETEKEEEQKNLILLIVTVVLAVVPFVGEELAGAAGLAALARAIAIAGEAGNAAFDIYSMVDDPSSIGYTIFGTLFGAAGIASSFRNADHFSSAGEARRAMGEAKVAQMGDTFKGYSELTQKIVKSCKL
ncbi:Mutanase [Colletotrichum siamense]|uniref:Mutanase n=1 Tax=Colletotrichum siamense TaxID=690259 RepID=UPI00187320AE|nr:Mutanase [Colletotrichum siamense]KAF5501368.1 Mutanase [Colletotrichum siamense]